MNRVSSAPHRPWCGLLAILVVGVAGASEVSVLPDGQGVGLRIADRVYRYDAGGESAEPHRDVLQRAPVGLLTNVGAPSPGEPLFWALPEVGGREAVVLGSTIPGAPLCERVRLEDGRFVQLLRVLAPVRPQPGGSTESREVGAFELGREAVLDAVYRWDAVARGADARVLTAAYRAGSSTLEALQFAPDCESVGQPLPRVRALTAHPAVEGGWVVRSIDGDVLPPVHFVLERLLEGAVTRQVDLLGWLPPSPSSLWMSPTFWLKGMDDGGVLLAASPFDSERIHLRRYDEAGQLIASAEIDGAGLAGIVQTASGLMLAVRTPLRTGASLVLQLSSDLQVRGSVELPGVYLHGPLPSVEHGLEGTDWLLSNVPWAVRHEQYSPSMPSSNALFALFGLARLAEGPSLTMQTPLSGLRPRLRLADGRLLATSHEGATLQAWYVPPLGGSASRLPLPATDLSWRPVLSQAEHSQGSMRLVSAADGTELQFIEPSGSVRWRVAAAGDLLRGADADRVCVARRAFSSICFNGVCGLYNEVTVQCFQVDDGAPLPVVSLLSTGAESKQPPPLFGSVAVNGDMVVYDVRSPGFQSSFWEWETAQLRVTRNGAASSRSFALPPTGPGVVPDWRGTPQQQWLQGIRGEVILAETQSTSGGRDVQLHRFDTTGVETASALPGARAGWVRLLGMDDSGALLLHAGPAGSAPGVGTPQLRALSASLAVQWVDPLGLFATWPASNALKGLPIVARTPDGRRWAVSRDARHVDLLDALDGELVGTLRLPALDHDGGTPGWALAAGEAGDELVMLRTGQRGAELRRLYAGTFDVGTPARLDSARTADRRLAGVHLHGPRLFVGPAARGEPVRTLEAPARAASLPVDGRHTGLWYDPTTTGHGLMLDVEEGSGRWFAGWFTYADTQIGSGTAWMERQRPVWFTALGRAREGSGPLPVQGALYETQGGDFAGALVPTTSDVGEAELRAIDCNTIEFSYRIRVPGAEPLQTWRSGSRRLQRLGPPPEGCHGSAPFAPRGLARGSSGSWVLEGRSSQGVLMQVDPSAEGGLWGAWFGFVPDQDGITHRQHWLTWVGRAVPDQPGVVELQWMRTLGGGFDSHATHNTRVIGTGRLRFTACDRGVLEYRFDAPGLPGDVFAGMQGQVALRRFDACAMP